MDASPSAIRPKPPAGSRAGIGGTVVGPRIQTSSVRYQGSASPRRKRRSRTTTTQTDLANFGTVNVVQDAAYCGDETWNGCGPDLPDWLHDAADSVNGFQDACNSHDVCYGNCGNTRKECEDEFWVDMYAQCDGSYLNYYFCRVLADIFHAGTYTQGERYCIEGRGDCTQAQQNSCRI